MKIQDFEKELQSLDNNITIHSSPNKGLACVYYKGVFTNISVPDDEIFDEPNPSYGIDHPSGKFLQHRTRPIAKSMIEAFVSRIKNDQDYSDAFFGVGEYSEAALK